MAKRALESLFLSLARKVECKVFVVEIEFAFDDELSLFCELKDIVLSQFQVL
jgi:hypothetical protein